MYTPFLYRVIAEPVRVQFTTEPVSTVRSIRGLQEAAPFLASFVITLQIIIGVEVAWVAIPPALILTVPVYKILHPLPSQPRLIATFASLAGPLGAIRYTFYFRRYYINIGIFLTFVLLLHIFAKRNEQIPIAVLAGIFSFILWLNHYTFWPYFAVTIVTLAFLHSKHTKGSFTLYISALVAPFVLYSTPSEPYLKVIPVFTGGLSQMKFDSVGSFLNSFSEQGLLADPILSVPQIPEPSPAWMPEFLYLSYLVPLIVMVVLWISLSSVRIFSAGNGLWENLMLHKVDRQVLLSTSVGFVVLSGVYILVGFYFRIFTFWPILLPIFLSDLWKATERLPSRIRNSPSWRTRSKQIIIVSILLISLLHLAPVFLGDYLDAPQQPGLASQSQIESSRHAKYIDSSKPLYTDLLHASIAIIDTEHRYIFVGNGAATGNGSILLDEHASQLFDPSGVDHGYVLVSTSGTNGVPINGANVPTSNSESHGVRCDRVYTNGNDEWFLECGNDRTHSTNTRYNS